MTSTLIECESSLGRFDQLQGELWAQMRVGGLQKGLKMSKNQPLVQVIHGKRHCCCSSPILVGGPCRGVANLVASLLLLLLLLPNPDVLSSSRRSHMKSTD